MAQRAHTYYEIESQPHVWETTLTRGARLARSVPPMVGDSLIVAGCGSTYYLSLTIAAIATKLGLAACATPSSEYLNLPSTATRSETLLLISRSGTTTETLWALDAFRKLHPGGLAVVVTTQPESPLARAADVVLDAPDAQEQSLAQTRSFTSMMLLGQSLLGAWTGNEEYVESLRILPARLTDLLDRTGDLPERLGSSPSLRRFFYLGGGPLYGLACEAMMKTKEMTGSWVEAYHPLEVRHGPMALMDEETLVAGFVSSNGEEAQLRVLRDMKRFGATTVALLEDASTVSGEGLDGIDHVVELRSGLSEWARGVLYLPFVQWLAYYRAVAAGLNPDQPHNLVASIQL